MSRRKRSFWQRLEAGIHAFLVKYEDDSEKIFVAKKPMVDSLEVIATALNLAKLSDAIRVAAGTLVTIILQAKLGYRPAGITKDGEICYLKIDGMPEKMANVVLFPHIAPDIPED